MCEAEGDPTRNPMQSLYALGALLIAGMLALTVQQYAADADRRMITSEGEALVLAAAEDELAWAATLPFDASVSGSLDALTTPSLFGTAAATFEAAQDLDDLHGARRSVSVEAGEGAVTLRLTASVRYLVRNGGTLVPSPTPTRLKELTVRTTGPQNATVVLSRVYPLRPSL